MGEILAYLGLTVMAGVGIAIVVGHMRQMKQERDSEIAATRERAESQRVAAARAQIRSVTPREAVLRQAKPVPVAAMTARAATERDDVEARRRADGGVAGSSD